MTNKEAIEQLEWIYQNGFDNDFEIDSIVRNLDAIRAGIEALENVDKYRWHDLEKNPNDLPPMYESVETFDGCVYEISSRVKMLDSDLLSDLLWTWESSYGYFTDERDGIIAWRYIKPFEEEA